MFGYSLTSVHIITIQTHPNQSLIFIAQLKYPRLPVGYLCFGSQGPSILLMLLLLSVKTTSKDFMVSVGGNFMLDILLVDLEHASATFCGTKCLF